MYNHYKYLKINRIDVFTPMRPQIYIKIGNPANLELLQDIHYYQINNSYRNSYQCTVKSIKQATMTGNDVS